MTDFDQNDSAEHTCLMCGRHLNSSNRSLLQPELCKECSGEENDAVIDDFK